MLSQASELKKTAAFVCLSLPPPPLSVCVSLCGCLSVGVSPWVSLRVCVCVCECLSECVLCSCVNFSTGEQACTSVPSVLGDTNLLSL